MTVKARKRFFNNLSKIKSWELLDDIDFIYNFSDTVKKPEDIPGFKWMTGYNSYGRISIEHYRIGVLVSGDTIIFLCAVDRADVYEVFP